MTSAATAAPRMQRWVKVLVAIGAVLAALVLLVAFFPWDTLRGPIGRYVSNKTGRHFEITRHLDVKVGRTTRVLMDGVEFANPDWAQDRYLVKADAAEVDVRLLPLLFQRRIELPMIKLTRPQLGLQLEPDGRKTWALGSDTKDDSNVPDIGAVVVDQGTAHYVARGQGADIRADFAMDRKADAAKSKGAQTALPLRFKAQGRWSDQPFTAEGGTGDVLSLTAPLQTPFPAEVQLAAGATRLRAHGTVSSLATLAGANVEFQVQGNNLAELHKLVGIVLPDTPRYSVAGQLSRQGEVWHVRGLDGRLGRSDIAGELAFDRSGKVPSLSGKVSSRMLDFEDLAPLIGMKDKPADKETKVVAAVPTDAKAKKDKAPKDPNRKVLPTAVVDVSRLKSMNADVTIDAAKVVNAKGLPIDRMSTHVQLKNGVLVLDPLDMGFAGGRLAGQLRLDANANPVAVQTRLDGRGLDLGRLVPASKAMRESIGKLQAQVDLNARGGSVAQMLGTASGNVALLMGKGEISNILLEIAGLDGGELIKFFIEGDRKVTTRCAAMAFDVNQGVMVSRALVLDTNDTVFTGNAKFDFTREAMDIYIKPEPKDQSILSLRSPLEIGGTFGAPTYGLDKAALAKRAVAAIALGAINPLLALAATVETGPGHDIDCVGTLKNAAAPRAQARVQQTAPPVPGSGGKTVDEPVQKMGAASAAKR